MAAPLGVSLRGINLAAGNQQKHLSNLSFPTNAEKSATFLTHLRWLNTVLRAVSGNLRDGASFKLDKQTWRRKSNDTQKPISQNLLIKIL